MDAYYSVVVSILVGLLVGILVGRLTRALIALAAVSGIVGAVMIVTGHADLLEANRDLLPQALSLGTQVAVALKRLLVTMPGALVGVLAGVAVHEIIRLVKS